MKKKFINALVLGGVAVLGVAGLVGCGQQEEPKEDPTPVTKMSIANKDELTAEWKIGEADRTMTFTFEGAKVNVASAIAKGLLTIKSSDTAVVVANGFVLQAAGTAGSAVITATYTNDASLGGTSFTDTVEVNVKESDKELAAESVTIKEFREAEYDGTNAKKAYLVTGKIKSIANTTYGNLTIEDETGELYFYGVTANNQNLTYADGKFSFPSQTTFSDIEFTKNLKVGDEITVMAIRADYNGSVQGKGIIVKKGDGIGENRVSPTALTVTQIVNDSNVTKGVKLFETEATIVGFGKSVDSLTDTNTSDVYGNMFVTDGTTVLQVYGATASANAIAWNGSMYKITNPQDFLTNEVTKNLKAGDKIKFTCVRADYYKDGVLQAIEITADSLVQVIEDDPNPVTGMEITNQDDLTAEWKLGEADRSIEFKFSGAQVNVAKAIEKGLLKIESSDVKVVSVSGSSLHTEGVGKATITVAYTNEEAKGGKSFSKSFEVEVIENDSEQAAKAVSLKEFKEVEIAKDSSGKLINKEIYKVTGKIKGFGKVEDSLSENASDAGDYGNLFLEDEDGESLQIYGSWCNANALTFADGKWSYSNPKSFKSSTFAQSLKVGDEVTMFLIRCDYGTVIEGCGRFVAGPTLIDPTAVELEKVVNDSDVTPSAKLFEVTATIKGFGKDVSSLSEEAKDAGDYGNMYVTDGTNTIQVYGATAGDSSISWTGTKFKFTNPKDFQTNEVTSGLKAGDKIKFVCIRADYNGVKEISIQSVAKVVE